MHDPVPHDDVSRRYVHPLLSAQLGEELIADGAVIGIGDSGRRALRGCESPHQVCTANDADELAVMDDRHPLYPLCLE